MILERRAVEPFQKNGFVIGCEETRQGVIIDPGDEVRDLLSIVKEHGLSIGNILLTHAHLDHVTGVAEAKQALNVPVWLHKDDDFLYQRVVEQGQMFGLRVKRQPPIDSFYDGEGPLRFGRYVVRGLHTPGHCPGGVCLAASKEPKEAKDTKERPRPVVGERVLAGSSGGTDLPGGNAETLLKSIRNVLFRFPDDTVVWSGHGPETTIGRERKTNPFLT